LLPAIVSGSRVLPVGLLTPGIAAASTLRLVRGTAGKSRLSAGRLLGNGDVPVAQNLKSEIHPIVRTITRGSGCAPPANATPPPG
jgi:hypothetical protein